MAEVRTQPACAEVRLPGVVTWFWASCTVQPVSDGDVELAVRRLHANADRML